MGLLRKIIKYLIEFYNNPKKNWKVAEEIIKNNLGELFLFSVISFFICLLFVEYRQSSWSSFLYLLIEHQITVQTIIALVGGYFVYRTLKLGYEKYNQTQKQISLTEDNNLNTTFKDAVTLLGNDNVSVRMGGVHTLIDIAKKTSNTNNSYAEKVNNILCQHIVDRSNIEYYEYLEFNSISKKQASIFEDINIIQKIYVYRKYYNDKKTVAKNIYESDGYWKYIDRDVTVTSKTYIPLKNDEIEDIYNRIKNLSQKYSFYMNSILDFKSSKEVKSTIRLMFIENSGLFSNYISDLSYSKLFEINFIRNRDKKNLFKNNIKLYNCIAKKINIQEKDLYEFRIEKSIVYKSDIHKINKLYANQSIFIESQFSDVFKYQNCYFIACLFILVTNKDELKNFNSNYGSECHYCHFKIGTNFSLLDFLSNSLTKIDNCYISYDTSIKLTSEQRNKIVKSNIIISTIFEIYYENHYKIF